MLAWTASGSPTTAPARFGTHLSSFISHVLPVPPTFYCPRAATLCYPPCPPACFASRSPTPSHLIAPPCSSPYLRVPWQLDTVPATIEMLPDIVRAVAGRVEVYMDGGVTRGTDVMKVRAFEQ